MKRALTLVCAVSAPLLFSQSALAQFDYFNTDGSFKRFSVSAGWLHAKPTGDATPIQNTTAIKDGTVAKNGSVKAKTVKDIIVPNQAPNIMSSLEILDALSADTDLSNVEGIGDVSGATKISGLQSFATPGTGLESDDVDTVGMLFTYYLNDHWAVEMKAGFPPKVDILGKGAVVAPFSGMASSPAIENEFKVAKAIPITNMTQGGGVASTARAWLPAALVQYQFGKSGVDKLRPYVGVGVLGAYFSDIELNPGIDKDLVAAGHMIQNIKNGKAGASLENKVSNSGMHVDVEADTVLAPILNVGATYDLENDWFLVGSLSYAKLDSDTTITVKNDAGEELIKAVSNIDIDPYISYLGVGYRF